MYHPEYQPDFFPDWTTMPVRFRDLDPLNHVNNAIYSTMFEDARIHFIRKLPAFQSTFEEQTGFVLVNLNIDFISQLQYPAQALIGTGIKKLGNSSIQSFQAIYHEEEKRLVATAQVTGVWFDLEKQRPTRLPDRESLEQFIIQLPVEDESN